MERKKVVVAADDDAGLGGERESEEFVIARVAAGWAQVAGLNREHGEQPEVLMDEAHELLPRLGIQILIEFWTRQNLVQLRQSIDPGADLALIYSGQQDSMGSRIGTDRCTD